ncbi:hypothetical protein [Streptomyces odontomachi]|uniref:hypothetical protein n=1 Tax=Streptomyces odontomachi TaxID=2944940 RepID=UPI00210CAD5F|nr:hypothetical protein [Streptomyces sp. ODS25]
MRKISITLSALGTAVVLGVAGTTAQADAAPQTKPAGATEKIQNTQVHAWTGANVHSEPNSYSEVISSVANGYTYDAICWTYGELITFHGVTSNKWVLLDRTWPSSNGYVTAIALSGDSTGGVPNAC